MGGYRSPLPRYRMVFRLVPAFRRLDVGFQKEQWPEHAFHAICGRRPMLLWKVSHKLFSKSITTVIVVAVTGRRAETLLTLTRFSTCEELSSGYIHFVKLFQNASLRILLFHGKNRKPGKKFPAARIILS